MQLIDELGMIYTTCLMLYASLAYSRSTTVAVILGTGLLGLAAFITVRSVTPEMCGQGLVLTASEAGLLSHNERSSFPSGRLCCAYRDSSVPEHVGDGVSPSTCTQGPGLSACELRAWYYVEDGSHRSGNLRYLHRVLMFEVARLN